MACPSTTVQLTLLLLLSLPCIGVNLALHLLDP